VRGPGLRLALALLLAAGCGKERPARAVVRGAGFEDTTAKSGIEFKMAFLPQEQGLDFKVNLYDHGCGVAVSDFDGDGVDDLYFTNQLGPNALYRGRGDGTFEDVTAKSGADLALADRISVAAAFGDVDNDGDRDLYVTTTRGGNVFFRNEGKGRFVDATQAAGLAMVRHSESPVFFDYDGDGFLDLFVTNTAEWTFGDPDPKIKYYRGRANLLQMASSPPERSVLYRNRGDGTFEDVTERAGVGGSGWDGDVAVFDYDEDGRLDLLVTNMFGATRLFRNAGDGTFADVTRASLGRVPWGCMGAKAFDYDGDARLDLFLVDMHSDMWMTPGFDPSWIEEKRRYTFFTQRLAEVGVIVPGAEKEFADQFKLEYEDVFFGNALYRNLGGGKFEERSQEAGVETFWPWSVATGDFDNDGHEDVFVASGMGYPFPYWRNSLLMNNGDGTFTDRSGSTGIDPPAGGPTLGFKLGDIEATRSSRSAATGDFDGDGCLDLVVNNFNDHPYLLLNRWPPGNHVRFRLRGRASNRDAIGAVVRLHAGDRVMVRQVHAAGGYLAQSTNVVHFGLGNVASIDRCEIRWPSGRVQILERPAVGRLHEVVEPAK